MVRSPACCAGIRKTDWSQAVTPGEVPATQARRACGICRSPQARRQLERADCGPGISEEAIRERLTVSDDAAPAVALGTADVSQAPRERTSSVTSSSFNMLPNGRSVQLAPRKNKQPLSPGERAKMAEDWPARRANFGQSPVRQIHCGKGPRTRPETLEGRSLTDMAQETRMHALWMV